MPSTRKPLVPMVEQVKWERTTESRISTVIGLLPASLQPRIRPFGQFRRASSLGNLRSIAGLSGESTVEEPRPLSAPGPESPTTLDGSSPDDSTVAIVTGAALQEYPRGHRKSPSGINWRYAQQGTGLLSISADASLDDDNAPFTRRAYLDGLSYLLRSLPSDLDSYETEQIRSALSEGLTPPELGPSGGRAIGQAAPSGLPKSSVHRIVQSLVINIVLIAHFILPYLLLVLKAAASIERRYKMSETVIGHGMNCFSAAGRRCARVAEVVLTANDSTSRQGVSDTFAWTVEEITKGVSDGLGEGFVMARPKNLQ